MHHLIRRIPGVHEFLDLFANSERVARDYRTSACVDPYLVRRTQRGSDTLKLPISSIGDFEEGKKVFLTQVFNPDADFLFYPKSFWHHSLSVLPLLSPLSGFVRPSDGGTSARVTQRENLGL